MTFWTGIMNTIHINSLWLWIMNSDGPKIEPWGTPVVIDKVREFVPS